MFVYIVVEGQTEEEVVKSVLKPHFEQKNVYLNSIIVGTASGFRGGGGQWRTWQRDIRNALKHHKGPKVRVTTLFDLFRLPRDFPGLEEHGGDLDTNRRCDMLQREMADVIDHRCFIPYIQRHELEALVLASIGSLRGQLDHSDDLQGLDLLKTEIAGRDPEDINDGPNTAPSKRLARLIPGYRKTLHGPDAIKAAGLHTVRASCPRFDKWLTTIEGLQSSSPASA